jgi:hypothetical protein
LFFAEYQNEYANDEAMFLDLVIKNERLKLGNFLKETKREDSNRWDSIFLLTKPGRTAEVSESQRKKLSDEEVRSRLDLLIKVSEQPFLATICSAFESSTSRGLNVCSPKNLNSFFLKILRIFVSSFPRVFIGLIEYLSETVPEPNRKKRVVNTRFFKTLSRVLSMTKKFEQTYKDIRKKHEVKDETGEQILEEVEKRLENANKLALTSIYLCFRRILSKKQKVSDFRTTSSTSAGTFL